jgi:radical SAM superfamily enzyme YgiQ (UPF0313 family)
MPLVILISTYELGRQPFGLASPAAWLARAGAEVLLNDTAIEALNEEAIKQAVLVGFYLPMHTATRIAAPLISRARALNPTATIVCYGLYAPMNEALLRSLGADAVIGGEFESTLVALYEEVRPLPRITRIHADSRGCFDVQQSGANPRQSALSAVNPLSIRLEKLSFLPPERSQLPPLHKYAALVHAGEQRITGYTEATRGCKHTCRHCPVVPVYGGQFRVVQREVVLADIRQQVAAGAQHITFGDPDFFNGPGHATRLVRQLHAEFPQLTYDVTIKVEHLLQHADLLPTLRDTGCVLITSAFEAFDEGILQRFAKQHSRAEAAQAVALCRANGLALNPTFVAFTPWTTREIYIDFLRAIAELGLVEAVAPVQYGIRLLIPQGSLLLELAELQPLLEPFDHGRLCYPWRHPDASMNALQPHIQQLAAESVARGEARQQFFERIWHLATNGLPPPIEHWLPQPPIPFMTEPWYC